MTTEHALWVATLGAALGCGLVAGVLFAFSSFVMPALARLPSPQGIAAMQSINLAAITRSFLGVFVGTGALCAVIAVISLVRLDAPGSLVCSIGALLYLVGTIGITRACNIPRNNALAAVQPDAPGAAAQWTRYLASWTAWNHVRTVAALAAAAALIIGSDG